MENLMKINLVNLNWLKKVSHKWLKVTLNENSGEKLLNEN